MFYIERERFIILIYLPSWSRSKGQSSPISLLKMCVKIKFALENFNSFEFYKVLLNTQVNTRVTIDDKNESYEQ